MEAAGPRFEAKVGHAAKSVANGPRSSLAQLESVLQRLNKHEEHSHVQIVERSSTDAQVKLLRDQLLGVQEELALAQASKGKMCEEIGALQQAKSDQHAQIVQLLSELRVSRDSQAAMAVKVADVENGSQDLKRSYIRSLTCRVKVASELLCKLHAAHCFDQDEFSRDFLSKCDTWNSTEANKKKRTRSNEEIAAAQKLGAVDYMMEGAEGPDFSSGPLDEQQHRILMNGPTSTPSHIRSEVPEKTISDMGDTNPTPICGRVGYADKEEATCESCIRLARQNADMKSTADKDLEEANSALSALQVQIDNLAVACDEARCAANQHLKTVNEKDEQIKQLHENLEFQRQKVADANEVKSSDTDKTEKTDAADDKNARIKVLEENLAQLNTYADHLELIISQCVSCSVKLQTENTQT